MRIILAGTPDFAANIFSEIIKVKEFEIVAALTQPDRKSGRGQKLIFSPVKQLALENHIKLLQPNSLKRNADEHIEILKGLKPDVILVAAYGLILPKAVLEIPTHGCVNIHASLLPRWRGAAPIQHAIKAQDKETGITIMQMEEGLDTGPMFSTDEVKIEAEDNAKTLHDKLIDCATPLTIKTLKQIANSSVNPEKQSDEGATYAHKITKEQAKIDWTDSAAKVCASIRAFNPWPVAFTTTNKNRVIRVWQATATDSHPENKPGTIIATNNTGIEVATGKGVVVLQELQMPGKSKVNVAQLINGLPEDLAVGTTLG